VDLGFAVYDLRWWGGGMWFDEVMGAVDIFLGFFRGWIGVPGADADAG